MITKVRARYANGVLTPLEPLDLEEGVEVVLSLEGTLSGGPSDISGELTMELKIERGPPKFRVAPIQDGFVPGFDPKKLKQFLNDEDDERYLRSENKSK